jgi:hypothetical protein
MNTKKMFNKKRSKTMAVPAYMFLKDDGGAEIKGSVTVVGREGEC